MEKFKKLLSLFLAFFKVGLFTFGGGYAMIAVIENEIVSKKGWLTGEEYMSVIGIAESTPGPIAINSATYIGYKRAGVWGSVFATLGVVLPSFLIILLIASFFNDFLNVPLVAAAFRGIQVGVTFLILSAGVRMFKKLKKNAFNVVFAVLVACLLVSFSFFGIGFSSVFYILISGLAGVILYAVQKPGESAK